MIRAELVGFLDNVCLKMRLGEVVVAVWGVDGAAEFSTPSIRGVLFQCRSLRSSCSMIEGILDDDDLIMRLGEIVASCVSILSIRDVLIIGIGVRRARVGGRRGIGLTTGFLGDVAIDRTVLEQPDLCNLVPSR